MQCNCGKKTVPTTFQITTLDKAIEYNPLVEPEHLPITVDMDICPTCGRMKIKVFSDEVLVWANHRMPRVNYQNRWAGRVKSAGTY